MFQNQYGLKKTMKYAFKKLKNSWKLRFTFIEKYWCHFVDLDDRRKMIFNIRQRASKLVGEKLIKKKPENA